jgi:Tannase and feruloyl esterase
MKSSGKWHTLVVVFALAAVVVTAGGHAKAASGLADLPAIPPVMDCAAVAQLDLTGVTDAPVTITSATIVPAGTGASPLSPTPYCLVRGNIAPANTIVMRLPTQGWTQRYLETGCGGLCGSSNISYGQGAQCLPVKDGTIASATTDMGHQGGGFNATWAINNPQAQIDFAYRGMHVTAQVAKAIIAKFYGKAPAYSYFNGCSDGGREALMEAQRYPEDFDGIAAGAPANDLVEQNSFHHGWNVVTNKDANGNYILVAGKLPLIHAAVLAACDALDGVTDGLIDDPRNCHFDPATLVCTLGQDPATCLTEAEAGVVRRLHDGGTDPHGRRLDQYIAHEWGSELAWNLFVPATATQTAPTFSENAALGFVRYLAYFNTYLPSFQLADLQFTVPSFWQTMQTSIYSAATDPDLTRFASHGGKLLLWHGWSDQHITPQGTLEYYDAMQKTMGPKVVDSFAKLYLFPGVTHCGGGEGPDSFDVLTPVMAWVETGTIPDEVIASKVANNITTRTRPVFPYPTVARYVGPGSFDDATNFFAYTPRGGPGSDSSDYNWVGRQLYSHGYQAWCQAVGTQLVCNPSSLPFGE